MERRITRSMRREEERLKAEEEMKEVYELGNQMMRRAQRLGNAEYPKKCKLSPGYRSTKDDIKALTWRCPACKKVNRPKRCLLVCLPAPRCECGHESKIDFDFSMHKLDVNNHFLIPNIREQKLKECSPCSMLTLAEVCWRTNAIISGYKLKDNEPTLNKSDLLEKFNYLCGVCEIENRFNETAVWTMFEIFSSIGVESEEKKPQMYVLPYYSALKRNFTGICQLLADGHAIRTSFYAGKNFGQLKPGQIYKSPGRGRSRHAIVLIGAGRRRGTEYYHFVNSWGDRFCLRYRKRCKVRKLRVQLLNGAHKRQKARGGFGILRASDIVGRPVTFLRHDTDLEYYKQFLHEDVVPHGKTRDVPLEVSIGALALQEMPCALEVSDTRLQSTSHIQCNRPFNQNIGKRFSKGHLIPKPVAVCPGNSDTSSTTLLLGHDSDWKQAPFLSDTQEANKEEKKEEKKDALNKILQLERQNADQNDSLNLGRFEQQKADEQALQLLDKHKEEKKDALNKILQLERQNADQNDSLNMDRIEQQKAEQALQLLEKHKEEKKDALNKILQLDEIQDAKKKLIMALTDLLGPSSNTIKRMGELVEEPFILSCKQRLCI